MMKKSQIQLEFNRFKEKHLILLIPIVVLVVSLSGYYLGMAYNTNVNIKSEIYNIYSAITQFLFIFLSFVYAYVFTKDFSNGIYYFFKQIGYELKNNIKCKFILLFLLTIIPEIIFFDSFAFSKGFTEIGNIFYINIIMCLNIVFTLLLAVVISFIFKKTLQSSIFLFIFYIICNVGNLNLFGLLNPSDANSLGSMYIRNILDIKISNTDIFKFVSDNSMIFGILPVIIYISLEILLVIILLRKIKGKLI